MYCMPLLHNHFTQVSDGETGLYTDGYASTPIWAELTDSSYSITLNQGKVISVWMKYNNGYDSTMASGDWSVQGGTGTIVANVYAAWGMSTVARYNEELEENEYFQVVELITYNQGSGSGNAGAIFRWEFDYNPGWHHLCFRCQAASGAFPGNFQWKLWFDGVSKGTKSASGPSTYSLVQKTGETFMFGELKGIGPNGAGITSIGSKSKGCVAQLWIGSDSSNFDIADFYDEGLIDLGTDGTSGGTKTLATPNVYERFNYPFSSGINGTLTLYEGDSSVSVSDQFDCYKQQ